MATAQASSPIAPKVSSNGTLGVPPMFMPGISGIFAMILSIRWACVHQNKVTFEELSVQTLQEN
jgi:hypothetical protein